jgi:hypothetical protein
MMIPRMQGRALALVFYFFWVCGGSFEMEFRGLDVRSLGTEDEMQKKFYHVILTQLRRSM